MDFANYYISAYMLAKAQGILKLVNTDICIVRFPYLEAPNQWGNPQPL